MIETSSEAGVSMLELLIGLAIFAGLLMVAGSVVGPAALRTDEGAAVASFIERARSEVILTGRAGLLVAGPEGISFADRTLAVAEAAASREAVELLVYPDGTMAGDVAGFVRAAGLSKIAGVFRGKVDE